MDSNPISSGVSTLRVEYFDCACHSFDHSLRFAFDPTEEDVRCLEIWVDAHFPSNRPMWQRIVMAAKYVFKMGELDWTHGSWIMKHEDEIRFKAFMREYELTVWKLKALAQAKKEGTNASIETNSV
jgi:hypothetical protein